MVTDTTLQQIENYVDDIISAEPEYFRVDIKIKPTNNIKVFIDGDNGLAIEKCVRFNRRLYKIVEEAALFTEGDFSLELSSPGVDEPLKMLRQYKKNIGRFVAIVFMDNSAKEGKLIEVAEDDIMIEEMTGKGKNAKTQQLVIPFNSIKTTTVQIKF